MIHPLALSAAKKEHGRSAVLRRVVIPLMTIFYWLSLLFLHLCAAVLTMITAAAVKRAMQKTIHMLSLPPTPVLAEVVVPVPFAVLLVFCATAAAFALLVS